MEGFLGEYLPRARWQQNYFEPVAEFGKPSSSQIRGFDKLHLPECLFQKKIKTF